MNNYPYRAFSRNAAKIHKPLFNGLVKSGKVSKKQKDESGALLVEVLVATLILVIVFTTASIALANMSQGRINIEQRDRALAILSSYEEQSRLFRCGFAVDRDVASPKVSIKNYPNFCDFEAKDGISDTPKVPANIGDQDFTIEEKLNPIDPSSPIQTFDVSIRYWWEVAGNDVTNQSCGLIKSELTPTGDTDPTNDQPTLLVRAFKVTWNEKGKEYNETLIKRDPTPVDDVVFASGARVGILVDVSSVKDIALYPLAKPGDGSNGYETSVYIKRIIDPPDDNMGQPTSCSWFPYLTDDGKDRGVKMGSGSITVKSPYIGLKDVS